MSSRKRTNSGQNRGADTQAFDMWRPPPPLPEPRPITIATDPSLMIRSIGDPPFGPKSVLAGHYLAALIDRAAGLATAIAASADLLAHDDNG
ncbi:MAG: hypothetical protein WCO88_08020 [Actinomycetota bacterium]